jgi:hypothetical protein
VNQFYDHPAYIDSIVERAKAFNFDDYDHILFSYHGLPERQVDKVYDDGLCEDQPCETVLNEENKFCYKATSYATTRLIAAKLGLKESDYTVDEKRKQIALTDDGISKADLTAKLKNNGYDVTKLTADANEQFFLSRSMWHIRGRLA